MQNSIMFDYFSLICVFGGLNKPSSCFYKYSVFLLYYNRSYHVPIANISARFSMSIINQRHRNTLHCIQLDNPNIFAFRLRQHKESLNNSMYQVFTSHQITHI